VTDLAYRAIMGTLGSIATALRIHRQTILCLHSVAPPRAENAFRSRISVDAEFLIMIAETVDRQGIPLIPLTEAVHRIRVGDTSPFVVLTFDDGYRDNYENLYGIALIYKLPFTIFITTGLVDREVPMWWNTLERLDASRPRSSTGRRLVADPSLVAVVDKFRCSRGDSHRALIDELARNESSLSDHDPYGQALTWTMLREMLGSGLLTVGAHTVTHPQLSLLSATEIRAELSTCRQRIKEELDVDPQFLAYPFGQPDEFGPLAGRMAREEGFTAAFTTEPRPLRASDAKDLFHLPRILLSNKTQGRNVTMAYLSGMAAAAKSVMRYGMKS